jgi:superfamily II DNA or RNA helicase
MRVKISGWVALPKSDLNHGRLAVIRDMLTIQPRKTSEHQDMVLPIRLYEEDEEFLRVPREWFFANRRENHAYSIEVADGAEIPTERAKMAERILSPEGVWKEFKLREEQLKAKQHVVDRYKATFEPSPASLGTSLQAPTGWGKTIWAASVISEIRRKTLVLVHKEFLLNQWRERLQTVMPGIKIGLIQEQKAELDADVCIGMIQSLGAWAGEMKKHGYTVGKGPPDWEGKTRFPPDMVHSFGLIIADEEHRMGAPTWVPVCPLFTARFRLGLTATPRRKDGCENAFFWHLGTIGFTATERRLIPKIRRATTSFDIFRTPTMEPGQLTRSTKMKILCANEVRNRFIAEELGRAVKAGRKVLVLSEKLKHLDRIKAQFEKVRGPLEVPASAWTDFYVGGRSEEELEVAGRADVILGTYQMAAEGLDLPWVDTLFLASPKSDVEQAVGRILRPFDGKKEPLVVDFIDQLIDDFAAMSGRREEFYKKFGTPFVLRKGGQGTVGQGSS